MIDSPAPPPHTTVTDAATSTVTVTAAREPALAAEAAETALAVLADLYRAAQPAVTTTPDTVEIADGDQPATLTVTLRCADGSLGGFGVYPPTDSPCEVATLGATGRAAVADGLAQEFTVHHHTTAPTCPGHRHPARARARGGLALWCCPDDVTRAWPLGAIPAPPRTLAHDTETG